MNGYVQPFTIEERLAHIEAAKEQLQTKMPWIGDNMGNEIKHAFGNRNNSEFVIAPDGKIVHARTWSDPGQLRDDLAALVGRVTPPTRFADLGFKDLDRPDRAAASGIVQGVPKPSGAVPLKCVPLIDQGATAAPFYVKLRAEAESDVIERGQGKIHLAFHLDPIHHVHWNNLAKPIHYEIKTETGEVRPPTGDGPVIEDEEADLDPREFLVEVKNLDQSQILTLKVDYFACHDVEKWCKAVSQTYHIHLERDRDAGTMRGGRGGRGGGRPGASRGSFGPSRDRLAMMMEALPIYQALDADGDHEISSEEVSAAAERLLTLDQDGDGVLSRREISPRGSPFGGGRPPFGGGGPPRR